MCNVTCPQLSAQLYDPAIPAPSASALSHRHNVFNDPSSPSSPLSCMEPSVSTHVVPRSPCSWTHPCRCPLGLSHCRNYQRRQYPQICRIQGRGPSTRRHPQSPPLVRRVAPILYRLLRLTLSPRALIKTAPPENELAAEDFSRECTSYHLPGVSSAACFRQMYDKIDDCTVAFEWMDATLRELDYRPDMRIYSVIKSVLGAALTSCVVLDDQKHVNTGTVPILGQPASAYQSRLQNR